MIGRIHKHPSRYLKVKLLFVSLDSCDQRLLSFDVQIFAFEQLVELIVIGRLHQCNIVLVLSKVFQKGDQVSLVQSQSEVKWTQRMELDTLEVL